MRVTIIVPIYGVEKYIEECAVSLFSQTYADIEYIFYNDCTKDRSIEILEDVISRYPDRKESIQILSGTENVGLGGARVELVKAIRTECFSIVDSDDILPLDAIDILVKRMKQTDADIVEGAYRNSQNGTLSEILLPFHGKDATYLNRILCQDIEIHRVWGKLYKTSVINKVPELFVKGIDMCEDFCATARLLAVCSRSWTDEVVYHYRTDNISSYTNNITEKSLRSALQADRKVLFFYLRRGHLPLSLEVGMLNAYRTCIKNGFTTEMADEILMYYPEHLSAKILYRMFKQKVLPFRITEILYKVLRSIACR